jgi:hypothetical protein
MLQGKVKVSSNARNENVDSNTLEVQAHIGENNLFRDTARANATECHSRERLPKRYI